MSDFANFEDMVRVQPFFYPERVHQSNQFYMFTEKDSIEKAVLNFLRHNKYPIKYRDVNGNILTSNFGDANYNTLELKDFNLITLNAPIDSGLYDKKLTLLPTQSNEFRGFPLPDLSINSVKWSRVSTVGTQPATYIGSGRQLSDLKILTSTDTLRIDKFTMKHRHYVTDVNLAASEAPLNFPGKYTALNVGLKIWTKSVSTGSTGTKYYSNIIPKSIIQSLINDKYTLRARSQDYYNYGSTAWEQDMVFQIDFPTSIGVESDPDGTVEWDMGIEAYPYNSITSFVQTPFWVNPIRWSHPITPRTTPPAVGTNKITLNDWSAVAAFGRFQSKSSYRSVLGQRMGSDTAVRTAIKNYYGQLTPTAASNALTIASFNTVPGASTNDFAIAPEISTSRAFFTHIKDYRPGENYTNEERYETVSASSLNNTFIAIGPKPDITDAYQGKARYIAYVNSSGELEFVVSCTGEFNSGQTWDFDGVTLNVIYHWNMRNYGVGSSISQDVWPQRRVDIDVDGDGTP